ncbi:MAG: multicopper oxidase domain-containing protein, partial [Methylomicrobium sp.]|nr:multicopper oxidase domain-containing protein [Methylomicrobium sp.]
MGGGMMGGGRRGMMGGGMMGMMSGSALPLGSEYNLFSVKVVKAGKGKSKLPEKLTPISKLKINDAANADKPRSIRLSMRHMSALLNGRSYKMNDVRADEIIPVNTLQVIEFDNGFGGMNGMAMPHPMHLHGEQFQVIKRQVNGNSSDTYASVSAGLVRGGWKDTVLVMPGEKVTVLKPFNDYTGLFMYHCHNLEHEDLGMMRDLLIK